MMAVQQSWREQALVTRTGNGSCLAEVAGAGNGDRPEELAGVFIKLLAALKAL